jgi:hypothetical protein
MKGLRRTIALIIIAALIGCSRDENINGSYGNGAGYQHTIRGQWVVEAIETVGDTIVFLHPADTIRVVFGEDSALTGRSSGRCGNYFDGVYEIGSPSNLRITYITSTKMDCPFSSCWSFIDAMRNVNRFELSHRLHLYYDGGSKRLWLRRELRLTE